MMVHIGPIITVKICINHEGGSIDGEDRFDHEAPQIGSIIMIRLQIELIHDGDDVDWTDYGVMRM